MNIEVEIIKDQAETIYISHPESSYGIFCYNSKGDLFLSSDYGMYGYAWRHYGEGSFKNFLSQTNAEYICGKFETNNAYLNSKRLPKHVIKHITVLIEEFIKVLKESLLCPMTDV